jgi:hypothetical protein
MRVLKIFGYLAVAVVGVMILVFSLARPSLPLKRFLTDREGKTYDIVVVGKEAGGLVVEPEGIPNPLEIPIQSLELKDWLFAHWLPRSEATSDSGITNLSNDHEFRRQGTQSAHHREKTGGPCRREGF